MLYSDAMQSTEQSTGFTVADSIEQTENSNSTLQERIGGKRERRIQPAMDLGLPGEPGYWGDSEETTESD